MVTFFTGGQKTAALMDTSPSIWWGLMWLFDIPLQYFTFGIIFMFY